MGAELRGTDSELASHELQGLAKGFVLAADGARVAVCKGAAALICIATPETDETGTTGELVLDSNGANPIGRRMHRSQPQTASVTNAGNAARCPHRWPW
jgi:hypothetical protein